MCFLCPACRFIPDEPFNDYACDEFLTPEYEWEINKTIQDLEEQYGQGRKTTES